MKIENNILAEETSDSHTAIGYSPGSTATREDSFT